MRTVRDVKDTRPKRRAFLHPSVLGLGYIESPKKKPKIAPPRWPIISEFVPEPMRTIITSMKMHMPTKQHLTCSS